MRKVFSAFMALGAGFLSLLSSVAEADDAMTPQPSAEVANGARGHLATPLGMSIGIGGGPTNFVGSDIGNITSVGGYWEVRLHIGTRSYVGAEVAYVGSVRHFNAAGLDPDAKLLGDGLETTLRINYPLEFNKLLLEPFSFGGVGWTNFSTQSATRPANIHASDDALVLPVGGGFGIGYSGFILEGRFTYRPTYWEQLVMFNNGASAGMNSWTAGALVAFEF